jgi:hypothetical protein
MNSIRRLTVETPSTPHVIGLFQLHNCHLSFTYIPNRQIPSHGQNKAGDLW